MVGGCNRVHEREVYTQKEWRDLFAKAESLLPLPFPVQDSDCRVGSIAEITDEGVRWLGGLEDCGCPMDEFKRPYDSYYRYKPFKISFNKYWGFEANAIFNFNGITAGPKFDRISKILIKVGDYSFSKDYFSPILFQRRIEWTNSRFGQNECLKRISKADRYYVIEVFRVLSGKFALYKKSGVGVKLKPSILADFLQFHPDIKYQVTRDGSLKLESPACFGIRAISLPSLLDIYGESGVVMADEDDKIERIFYGTVK
jgi:hypothetical protein